MARFRNIQARACKTASNGEVHEIKLDINSTVFETYLCTKLRHIYYGRFQRLKNNAVVRETVLTVDDVWTNIFNIKAGQQLQSYCCTNVCKHVHTSSFI